MKKLARLLAVIIARFVESCGGENGDGDPADDKLLETELVGEDGTVIGRCVIKTNGNTSTMLDAWLERPSRDRKAGCH